MPAHRAYIGSGLLLSFAILLWTCETAPGPEALPEPTGQATARAEGTLPAQLARATVGRTGTSADRTLAPYFFVQAAAPRRRSGFRAPRQRSI